MLNVDGVRYIAYIISILFEKAYKFIGNRVGKVARCSLDSSKIYALGWEPRRVFDTELPKIIKTTDSHRFI